MSEKRQLRATQMNQMLELVNKDFKAVIIKMLQQSNILVKQVEKWKISSKKEKKQKKITELKNTVTDF